MEPDYSRYTTDELREAQAAIDANAFPDRAKQIEQQLALKSVTDKLNTDSPRTERQAHFYACPSCMDKIGPFSKAMNTLQRVRFCPHCQHPFTVKMSFKALALMLVPAFLFNLLVFKPLFVSLGLFESLSTGLVCGVVALLSMRLQQARQSSVSATGTN